MKKILSILFFLGVLFFINGCVNSNAPQVNKSNEFTFILNDNKNFILKLDNPLYTNNKSSCISENALVDRKNKKYGYIHIHTLMVNSKCQWNGSAEGFFLNYLKKEYKIKSMKLVNSKTIGTYKFSYYKIESKKLKNLNLVYNWSARKSIFIVDEKGLLTKELRDSL